LRLINSTSNWPELRLSGCFGIGAQIRNLVLATILVRRMRLKIHQQATDPPSKPS
jgi:hypothetical protein